MSAFVPAVSSHLQYKAICLRYWSGLRLQRQIYLQNKLDITTPSYLHLPLAIDNNGKKISKTANADSIDSSKANETLYKALKFLGQKPDEELRTYDVESILDWAIQNWDTSLLPRQKEIIIDID